MTSPHPTTPSTTQSARAASSKRAAPRWPALLRLIRWSLVSPARAALEDRFSDADVHAVVNDAFADYERARESLPDEDQVGPRLMIHLAALTAGFHRALVARGLEPTDARRRTGLVTAAVYERMGGVPWALSRLHGKEPRARLEAATNLFRRFPFSAPGYEMVDVPAPDDVVAFDVRRCPVAEYLRAEGLAELCVETWCGLDFALAERWGARLERPQTLAGGGDRCDFRWRVVPSEEGGR